MKRCEVLGQFRLGDGVWIAYLEASGAWLGWEYEVIVNGERASGVALIHGGRPAIRVHVGKKLGRRANVIARPRRRLYPA